MPDAIMPLLSSLPGMGGGGLPPFLPGMGGSDPNGAAGGPATVGSGGGGMSGIMGLLAPLLGITGTVGNIMGNMERNKVLNSEMYQMNALDKLTPTQVTSGIAGMEVPLSGNLINTVGNATQAQLASRGLGQAPGIFASSLAQGLAPYQLQEQQMAQNAYFQKLGLPISARPSPFGPFPQQTNTSQLWQMMMQRFMNPNSPGSDMPPVTGPQGPSWSQLAPQGTLGDSGLGTGGLDPSSILNILGGGGLTPDTSGVSA